MDLSGVRNIQTFVQRITPSTQKTGDIWFKIGTNNKYYWNNSMWVNMVTDVSGSGSDYGYCIG